MATGVVRNSLECSFSGRGTVSVFSSLRPSRLPAVGLPTASVPVPRTIATPLRSTPDGFQQPPYNQPPARERLRPVKVAKEIKEKPKDWDGLTIGSVEELNNEWGVPGVIEFHIGQGGLPNVLITHPQLGMQLVVYLYGATIAQWVKSDGTATFYDGPDELYQSGMPLRTGVSLHFPQHREGPLPEHGFADSMLWTVVGTGFDSTEVRSKLDENLAKLRSDGLLTDELLAKAEEDEEAAAAVDKVLEENPPDTDLLTDVSPFILLRLRDTPETRQMWPHRFQLDYKITLQAMDYFTEEDIAELRAQGVLPTPGQDEVEQDPAAAEDAEGEDEEPQAPQAAKSNARAVEEPASPRRRRGRPRKNASAEGEEPGEGQAEVASADASEDDEDTEQESGSASMLGDEDEDDGPVRPNLEPGAVSPEPWTLPVQVKQEFELWNLDKPGSPPMEFNLASLARFVTMQQPDHGAWVKVLGLGGAQKFNYTQDPRFPEFELNLEDFLHYWGQPVDATYVGAAEATVYLCPGNRTHFEFVQRKGFRDMFVEQLGMDAAPWFERVATVGTGYVASKKKLKAGESWVAESLIRFHNRYWRPPMFGDDSMPPLPAISSQDLVMETDDEDDGEGEGGDAYDDIPGDSNAMPDREE